MLGWDTGKAFIAIKIMVKPKIHFGRRLNRKILAENWNSGEGILVPPMEHVCIKKIRIKFVMKCLEIRLFWLIPFDLGLESRN